MNTKRCSGHKKHWECADEYPDHVVPVSEFHLSSTSGHKDGIQGMCKKCFSYSDKIRWPKRPKHTVTGEVKKNWKHRIAISYGGVHGTPEWQSYLDKAEKQWQEEILQDVIYNITPPFRLARTRRPLPEIDRPKTQRVTTIQVNDPRGFVYIFKDHMKDEGLYKIGSSYKVKKRLDQADTWGDFESVYESEEVSDCAKLEKEVHQSLRKYQVKGEWFKADIDLIINKIEEIVDAGKEQEMGKASVS
jgi:hypothetical protein